MVGIFDLFLLVVTLMTRFHTENNNATFVPIIQKIWARMFRVYAHMFYHHWEKLWVFK